MSSVSSSFTKTSTRLRITSAVAAFTNLHTVAAVFSFLTSFLAFHSSSTSRTVSLTFSSYVITPCFDGADTTTLTVFAVLATGTFLPAIIFVITGQTMTFSSLWITPCREFLMTMAFLGTIKPK